MQRDCIKVGGLLHGALLVYQTNASVRQIIIDCTDGRQLLDFLNFNSLPVPSPPASGSES